MTAPSDSKTSSPTDADVTLTDGAEAPPSMDTEAPTLPLVSWSSYAIEREIGRGANGRVLLAREAKLDRDVALKELLRGVRSTEERFVREARITARLAHPSIIPVYDVGRWPTGRPFFAMKLVSGRTLTAEIAARARLEERLPLLPRLLSAIDAVAFAHERRIVHRDLKPDNVLLGPYGETLVIDWGLALDLADATGTTETRLAVGTPAYMSPEQAAGAPPDVRTDVYALGAVLYHLLSGSPPFTGPGAETALKHLLAGPPPPLGRAHPGIARELVAIVEKAMARDLGARYPTGSDLARDLERFLSGHLVLAHRYTPAQQLVRFARRHRRSFVAVATALVILAVGGVVAVSRVVLARDVAERAQREAEEQRARATERADELALLHAIATVERDPSEAMKWLRELSDAFPSFDAARIVAADAEARGVSVVLATNTRTVNGVAFSPDGSRLATVSDDHEVRLWDLPSPVPRVLRGHTDEAWFVAFSPDGTRVATSSKDETVRIWDARTGRTLHVLRGAGRACGDLTFSTDGARCIAHCEDATLRSWDLATEAGSVLCKGRERCDKSTFASDGRWVLTAGSDGALFLNDAATGEERSLPPAMRVFNERSVVGPWFPMALTAGGALVAAGDKEGMLRTWERATGRVRSFPGHTAPIQRVALSEGGALVASAAGDGRVLVRKASTGEVTARLRGPDMAVTGLSLTNDGRYLGASSADHSVYLWDLATGHLRRINSGADAIRHLAFSPDGALLASAGDDGDARLLATDASGNRVLGQLGRPSPAIAVPALGRSVVTGGANGELHTWPTSGGPPVTRAGHDGAITHLAASVEGDLLVSAGDDRTVRVWRVTGAGEVHPEKDRVLHLGGAARALALSRRGALVAVGDGTGTVRAWDVERDDVRVLGHHGGAVSTVAVSFDGARVASGGDDWTVRAWPALGGPEATFRGHRDPVRSVAFFPDGRTLASGGRDHAIWLWPSDGGGAGTSFDASGDGVTRLLIPPAGKNLAVIAGANFVRVFSREGALLRDLRGHTEPVLDADLSPDGRTLATASRDGTLRLWDLASGVSRALTGHVGPVLGVRWAPDGRWLASTGADGTVRYWVDDLPHDPARLKAAIVAATERIGGRGTALHP